jgi:hypothetical protein
VFPTCLPRKNVFISYRVSDTAGETGRLVDALKNQFEEDQIFMDIDKIEPGVDFTEVISRSLDSCEVMLAIIGPNWEGHDAHGQSRIRKSDDWVRLELSTALKRNIRVVPVLVDGATLPDVDELPEDLQGLTRRQSYEISNKRWRYDTDQLMGFLQHNIGVRPKRKITPQPTPVLPTGGNSGMSIWLKVGLGIFAFVGLLAVIGIIAGEGEKDTPKQEVQPLTGNNNNHTQQVTTDDPPPAATVQADIAGNWIDPEGSIIKIQQSNNRLNITVHNGNNNEQTGTGSGFIENGNVEMSLNMLNIAMVNLNLQLSTDGNHMTGSLTAVAGGKTTDMVTTLVRANE